MARLEQRLEKIEDEEDEEAAAATFHYNCKYTSIGPIQM